MSSVLNGDPWSIRGLSGICFGNYSYSLDFTWETKTSCVARAYRTDGRGYARAVASLRLSSKALAKVISIDQRPNLVALFDGLWVEVY